MQLSGNLRVIANILNECDFEGWAVTINKMDSGNIHLFTPWKEWEVTPGGIVTIKVHQMPIRDKQDLFEHELLAAQIRDSSDRLHTLLKQIARREKEGFIRIEADYLKALELMSNLSEYLPRLKASSQ